jgi:hypothetical protein
VRVERDEKQPEHTQRPRKEEPRGNQAGGNASRKSRPERYIIMHRDVLRYVPKTLPESSLFAFMSDGIITNAAVTCSVIISLHFMVK